MSAVQWRHITFQYKVVGHPASNMHISLSYITVCCSSCQMNISYKKASLILSRCLWKLIVLVAILVLVILTRLNKEEWCSCIPYGDLLGPYKDVIFVVVASLSCPRVSDVTFHVL